MCILFCFSFGRDRREGGPIRSRGGAGGGCHRGEKHWLPGDDPVCLCLGRPRVWHLRQRGAAQGHGEEGAIAQASAGAVFGVVMVVTVVVVGGGGNVRCEW